MNNSIKIPCLFVLAMCLHVKASPQEYSQHTTDSLVNALPGLKPDTGKVKVLYDIAYGFQNIDPGKGIKYGKRAIKLADSLDFQRGLATSYAMVGLNYAAQTDYHNALIYETKAIAYYKAIGKKKSEAAMLSNISLIYSRQADYPKALEHAYEAIRIYEDLGMKINQAYLLDNIGNIFFRQKDFEKALDHYRQSAAIYEAEGHKTGLARNKGNTGMVYHEQGEYSKALELHLQALAVNKQLGLKTSMQNDLTNIGNVLSSTEDYASALEQYQQALSINEELGNKGGVATTLGNIGMVYLNISESRMPEEVQVLPPDHSYLNKAVKYLTKSVEQCKELGLLQPAEGFSLSLSDAYSLLGNYKMALQSFQEYAAIQDSLTSTEVQERIGSLEVSREMEVKNKDLKLKEQELEIHRLELQRGRFIMGLTGLLILCAVVVIVVLWRKNRKHKHKRMELIKENEQYLEQITWQMDNLKKHSTVLSEIAYMQAHDVRGPVSRAC